MATPEVKVKDKVKKLLAEHGAYFLMPATHGFGSSGHQDIVACLSGRFIGVECKADGKKPTELQMKRLRELSSAGGYAVLVDLSGIPEFEELLSSLHLHPDGGYFDYLRGKREKKGA